MQEPREPQEGTTLQSPAPDPEHLRRRSGQRGPRGPPGSLRFPEGWRRRRRAAPHRRERGWPLQAESRARDDAAVTSVRGRRAGRAATPAPRRRRARPARTPRGRAHRPARSLVPGSAERSREPRGRGGAARRARAARGTLGNVVLGCLLERALTQRSFPSVPPCIHPLRAEYPRFYICSYHF